MALLGEDGLGYELATKLEESGTWKAWLGDHLHPQLLHHLASASSWNSFMTPGGLAKSKSDLHLQLRVRSLLFDKASASLHLSLSPSVSSLPSSYLHLHPDDVYYSLEDDVEDWTRLEAEGSLTVESLHGKGSNGILKRSFAATLDSGQSGTGSLNTTNESSLRYKNGEIPDTWFIQWREKQLLSRMQRLSWRLSQQQLAFGDRETERRTPEGMSAYLGISQKHRKRYEISEVTKNSNHNGSNLLTDSLTQEQICFFPEIMTPFNCVPDCASTGYKENNQVSMIETFGIFENLPSGRSPLLIERFGMDSEYLSVGVNTGKRKATKQKRVLSQEEEMQLSKQTVANIAAAAGFDSMTESSLEILSQLLTGHISQLGRKLRLLADSYKKHSSQTELLRMFLRSIGCSNLGTLTEKLKSSSNHSSQPQQPVQSVQQHQQMTVPHLQQAQKHSPRQFLLHHPNSAMAIQQQQWEKMRRQQPLTPQPTTPRSSGRKDKVIGDFNSENSNGTSIECKSQVPLIQHNHAQWQQQSFQASSQNLQQMPQYRPYAASQLAHIQQQGLVVQETEQTRGPPRKVDGFQELMGGNLNVKQEMDEEMAYALTSPRK